MIYSILPAFMKSVIARNTACKVTRALVVERDGKRVESLGLIYN